MPPLAAVDAQILTRVKSAPGTADGGSDPGGRVVEAAGGPGSLCSDEDSAQLMARGRSSSPRPNIVNPSRRQVDDVRQDERQRCVVATGFLRGLQGLLLNG